MDKNAGILLNDFVKIVSRLRNPGGCPWDMKQTPQSFKSYVIEEAYELLDAIDSGDSSHIREELGDLMFQLVFLASIYEEEGLFSLIDVIETISEKMIRRHPHVFGDDHVESLQEQRKRWHEIKEKEKSTKYESGDFLRSLPRSLPALRRAQRVSERVARTGFDWQDTLQSYQKVEEEISELGAALQSGNIDEISDEMGDSLFALVTLSRKAGINSEDCLKNATERFIDRFSRLESDLSGAGKTIMDTDYESLVAAWNNTKNN